jgi:hypothetical protein
MIRGPSVLPRPLKFMRQPLSRSSPKSADHPLAKTLQNRPQGSTQGKSSRRVQALAARPRSALTICIFLIFPVGTLDSGGGTLPKGGKVRVLYQNL